MKFVKIFPRALAAFCASTAFSQQSDAPHIAYVYPAGGRVGTTFTVMVGGNGFDGAQKAIFTSKGVSAKIIETTIPFTEGKRAQLRLQLEKEYILANPGTKEEVERLGKDGQEFLRKKTMEIPENREKLNEADASEYLRYVSSDALAESVELEVTVSPDAPLGESQVMLLSPSGLSNPFRFEIGALAEKSKISLRKEAYERARTKPYWGNAVGKFRNPPRIVTPENNAPIDIEIPCIANGQITENKTDFWKFKASKGQKIVVAVRAQSVLPYISDAVPGWFQTVVRVRNLSGAEAAYCDDFFHRPDSYLNFEVPEDGEYVVEIYDAVHRGREDFVYRMLIGEVPFVESVFPLGIEAFEKTKVELEGVNLKSKTDEIEKAFTGEFEYVLPNAYHYRIPMESSPFKAVLSDAEVARRGGKKYSGAAQELIIPSIVDGRITEKNQTDIFKFYLAGGAKTSIETFARRFDSPLDTYIVVADTAGKVVATADDYEDMSCGLVTHHADSRLEFTAPQSGYYFIRLSDSAGKFSPSHSYRLFLGSGAKDYMVRGSPSVINMQNGGTAAVSLKVFRRNGFDAAISVEPKNLPSGWKYSGGKIPSGKDAGVLFITASRDLKERVTPVELVARSSVRGGELARKVVPCEDMMQAFYYRHYVPFESFYACAGNDGGIYKGFANMRLEPVRDAVKIPLGSRFPIPIGKLGAGGAGRLTGEVEGADGIDCAAFVSDRNNLHAVVRAYGKNLKPGDSGELSIYINARAGRKIYSLDVAPSIRYVIISPRAEPTDSEKKDPDWRDRTKEFPPSPEADAAAVKSVEQSSQAKSSGKKAESSKHADKPAKDKKADKKVEKKAEKKSEKKTEKKKETKPEPEKDED